MTASSSRIAFSGDQQDLLAGQQGAVARAQLTDMGVSPNAVQRQIVAGRWQLASPTVVVTFTGPLPWTTKVTVAVLNSGRGATICGRTALQLHGLTRWESDLVHVVVDRGARPAHVDLSDCTSPGVM